MSFFSNSKRNRNINPNYGGGYYQRKGGLFNNLMNMIGSRSSGRQYYNEVPPQYPGYPPMQNQPNGMPPGAMQCAKCQSSIPAGSKFCLECGERVNTELFCPNCGEKLPGNAKFCMKCGTKING